MISIPIGLNRAGTETAGAAPASYVLLIILEDENISRLKQYDPGELSIAKLGEPWCNLKLAGIHFIYASPDEVKTLMSLPYTEIGSYIKKTLFRGWKYKPEEGDNDSSYQRPKEN